MDRVEISEENLVGVSGGEVVDDNEDNRLLDIVSDPIEVWEGTCGEDPELEESVRFLSESGCLVETPFRDVVLLALEVDCSETDTANIFTLRLADLFEPPLPCDEREPEDMSPREDARLFLLELNDSRRLIWLVSQNATLAKGSSLELLRDRKVAADSEEIGSFRITSETVRTS